MRPSDSHDEAEVTVQLNEGIPFSPPRATGQGEGATREVQSQSANPNSRYLLEGEVARGGMGIIYRVRDCDLSRTLAMKVMKSAPSTGQQETDPTSRLGLARFVEEAQVTA